MRRTLPLVRECRPYLRGGKAMLSLQSHVPCQRVGRPSLSIAKMCEVRLGLPRSDFGNHECDRQRCFACLAYRKFEEMEAHWLECPGLKKRAQGLCYYTAGCQEPRLPTFRHCAKHKGKLNDTIIDSFILLITPKLYV